MTNTTHDVTDASFGEEVLTSAAPVLLRRTRAARTRREMGWSV